MIRLAARLAVLCTVLAPALVAQSLYPDPEPPWIGDPAGELTNGIVASNRYVVMHVGSDEVGLGGVFAITSTGMSASLRFTAPVNRTAKGIWIFYEGVGSPGDLVVSLRDDTGGGRPVPGPVAASGTARPLVLGGPAWHFVPLGAPKALVRGEVYHVTIEPGTGSWTDDDRVELVTTRSRHPIPYLPGGVGSVTLNTPYDAAVAFMFDDGTGDGLLVQRRNLKSFNPVFLVDNFGAPPFGQPFDDHIEVEIAGDIEAGERVSFQQPLEFNYIAFYLRSACKGGQVGLLGRLFVRVLDESGAVVSGPHLLVNPPGADCLYPGRSHWFGRYLTEPVKFEAGEEYTFVLSSSETVSPAGYVFSIEASTVPVPAETLPTFGKTASHAVVSVDAGESFVPYPTGDSGFILGLYEGPPEASAVFDEFNANWSGQDYPLVACAGDPIALGAINRNIGSSLGTSSIWARLIDVRTGSILAFETWRPVLTNQETGKPLSFVMSNQDMQLLLELGHETVLGEFVIDDWIPLEIRLSADGCD